MFIVHRFGPLGHRSSTSDFVLAVFNVDTSKTDSGFASQHILRRA
jgi:hypothetical protein